MIPPKIHYIWFGGKPLPESVVKYIDSWKTYCPDYEIIRWDESNFDVHCCKYVEEAYNAKKWAFVSDYARFYALYTDGGIYLDTDMEMVRSFEPLRKHKAFFGFASEGLTLPVFGSEAHTEFIADMLNEYNKRSFIKEDGSYDTTPLDVPALNLLKRKYGLVENYQYQELKDGTAIYPKQYFYSTDANTGKITKYPELFCIHYADASWLSEEQKADMMRRRRLVKFLGENFGLYVDAFIYSLKKDGLMPTINKTISVFHKKAGK